MRLTRFTLVALGCTTLAFAGCSKKDEKKAEPTKAPVADKAPANKAPAPTPVAADKPADDSMPNKQKNCPNTVPGAATVVAEADGAVTITIAAGDAAAVKDIQDRTSALLKMEAKDADKVEHTGKGTGGADGKCAVFVKNVTATAANNDKGVVVTLKPKDGIDVATIKAEVEKRAAAK